MLPAKNSQTVPSAKTLFAFYGFPQETQVGKNCEFKKFNCIIDFCTYKQIQNDLKL